MRIIAVMACGLTAWTCGEKALGIQEQTLFAESAAIWGWGIMAAIWTLWGTVIAARGAE